MQPGHVSVGPFAVFNGTLEAAATLCLDAMAAGRGLRVATANLDFVARARRSSQLREDLAESSLVVADGAPVAWLARLAGGREIERISGVDLVAALFAGAPALGTMRVVTYGSIAAVADAAARAIEGAYPAVQVVAQICPPFRALSAAEQAADGETLAGSGAHLVLVALGCPKQERLIAERANLLPAATWVGVGGTLDFFAGVKKRAPRALQRAGGEWLARLAQDPRRLWRRYLVDDLPALGVVATQVAAKRVRHGRAPAAGATALRAHVLGGADVEGPPTAA